MTRDLDRALEEAVRGRGPETVALMRILMEAGTEADARAGLARAAAENEPAAARVTRIQALWQAHPRAWEIVRSTMAGIAHDRQEMSMEGMLRYWEKAFDRLAAASPEASVALYSFGSPDLLAAATNEVANCMAGWGLFGQERDALDLGCGIGRFLLALAPHLRSIVGLDLSGRMVEEARSRCRAVGNIGVRQGTGRDLQEVSAGSLDLVLAADVFPYLVQAGGGLAARHMAEFARVLRPGGAALILNYAYRGDLDADRRDVASDASASGLRVERNGTSDFTLWDGVTFLLRKTGS